MRAIIIALFLSTPCYSQSILESLAPRTDDAQAAAAHRARMQANAAQKEAFALGKSLRLLRADKRELEKHLEALEQQLADATQRQVQLKAAVKTIDEHVSSLAEAVKEEKFDDLKGLVANMRATFNTKIRPLIKSIPTAETHDESVNEDGAGQKPEQDAKQGSKSESGLETGNKSAVASP